MSHPPFKTALAALAALLLAGPQAQQATSTPTGTSRAGRRAAKAATPATPTAAQSTPPADGPQPPRPGDGPDPHHGKGPRPADGPGPHHASVQALSDFSGTLTGYLASNDDQVYDSFSFQTATGTETVRFPRHLAQALLAAAKAGSTVTVTGFRDTDPEGRPALHLVSLTASGQTVRDTPPARPPPAEEAATVRGTVQRLAQDPRGRTNAVLVSDGPVLRLPPGAAEQLADKLKVVAAVAATGNLHTLRPGEVAAKPVRVVRAQTITLDGVQFLVR